MDTTDGFIQNLFRTKKPPVSRRDFDNPNVWVCDLLNEDPALANQYLLYRLENAIDDDKRMAFLYECRHCFRYALKELKEHRDNPIPDWRPSCCGHPNFVSPEKSIKIYKSALNKVEQAICHLKDCEGLKCSNCDSSTQVNLTSHQWTLAFHIFFKALSIDTSNGGQINQILIARFLHLVTGEDCPDTFANSKYLDYVKNAPEFKRTKGKQIVQDLKAVRVHFERVGFSETLPMIDAMLTKYQRLK